MNTLRDSVNYVYDKAGNPTSRKELGLTMAYTFNNLNQLSSGSWTGKLTVIGEVNYAAGAVIVAGVTGTIYPDRTFDATNVTVTAGTNILTAVYYGPAFTNTPMVATDKVTVVVGNAAYTHDANGNLTGDQNFTYQYDLANRLTNVILKASNVSVFAASYDGLGRRIQVVRNGTMSERYVYLPGSFAMLAILDGSNVVKEFYTHGPDLSGTIGGAGGIGGILAVKYPQQTNAPTYSLHSDPLGNVVLTTDSQGNQAGQYQYSALGRLLSQSGSFRPRLLFSSKECDGETGTSHFGYRSLSTHLGRWITRDRVFERGGLNLYAYVRNRVPNNSDAFGNVELTWLYNGNADPSVVGHPWVWDKSMPPSTLGQTAIGVNLVCKCVCVADEKYKVVCEARIVTTITINDTLNQVGASIDGVYGHEQRHVVNARKRYPALFDAKIRSQFTGTYSPSACKENVNFLHKFYRIAFANAGSGGYDQEGHFPDPTGPAAGKDYPPIGAVPPPTE